MLDLRNLTPFQKRLAMLGDGAGFQSDFEGLSCPIDDAKSASFIGYRFSANDALMLSRRKFFFSVFGLDAYRVRVWLG